MSDSDSKQSTPPLWEVLEILGQRTGPTGYDEVLVAWKASWIPLDCVEPGPVLTTWSAVVKTRQVVLLDSDICASRDQTKRMRTTPD